MRSLLQTTINALISADADAVVGAEWESPAQPSPDRTAQRNGYRHRDLDTRVGTIDATARPLGDAGPFTFVAADALTRKVREGGLGINVVVLVAIGVNADGHREVLAPRVATSESGAARDSFFADLVTSGLGGVRLVTGDAHTGLVDAVGIFPNRDTIIRLDGAVLAERTDEWVEGRRYLGLDILAKSGRPHPRHRHPEPIEVLSGAPDMSSAMVSTFRACITLISASTSTMIHGAVRSCPSPTGSHRTRSLSISMQGHDG